MPFWKTGAATSRVTTVVTAVLLCVSCGPAEQGYWTKHGVSQALTNEQFPADSQHCEHFAAQNDGRYSDKAREKRYTKCMSAREYQWVVEEPVSLPDQSRGQSTHAQSCPAGYTNCIPGGTKVGGLNPEVNQSITREDSSHQNPALLPPNPSHQSNEQRLVMDRECRQQADATLSSPYAVYVTCMQEKGLSSPPAGGATADSVENEQPDHNKGHAQEDIGLQSAARNIGDEIPKIGPAIGNMFKQLGDKDTRDKDDKDKEKAYNRLGCATPQACPARHAAKSSAPPSAFTLKRKVKDQEKRIVELTTQLEMLKQIDHSRTKER